jgi:Zn-dependent peptidase ImmA (M78 family)
MPRDYHVSARSAESIAQLAYRLRDADGSINNANFNIVDFVSRTLPRQLEILKKGKLLIEFYDREFKEDDPAFVSFNPLTLNSDRQIWASATRGEDYQRFVIGHEIGHLVLHDHSAKAFSRDKSDQIKFGDDLQSAEWQANTFAGHFLLPDPVIQKLIQKIDNGAIIGTICQAPEILALQRISEFKKALQRKSRVFEGGFCPNCSNFSLVQIGTLLKCKTFQCDTVLSSV